MPNMKTSLPYKTLCTDYYDLDKPSAPQDALAYYLHHAKQAKGPILEPMCGTGRFLVPIAKAGFHITGFDNSPQMLDVCRNKCHKQNTHCQLFETNFKEFKPTNSYDLVFIPSGSFCLLTEKKEADVALASIHRWLELGGKLILEVETLNAKGASLGVWKADWVKKPDGSLIVLNHTEQFDEETSIKTVLCRYEHWNNNKIVQTEVEEFCQKLYGIKEIEDILKQHGFKIDKRIKPYSAHEAEESSEVILYECINE